jgi:ABC-2 type transport system ATP-binding protein
MIGYLPENNPLYEDMMVLEFLKFVADVRQIPSGERAQKIRTTVERCGLGSVLGKDIGQLSKGYRQRVGLAQALVHDPQVLVLDEPTSGLDPAQRVEIRELIRELAAGDRTVILSTHVLAEIEAICSRVVVINKGRIVAQDEIGNLTTVGRVVRVELARPSAAALAALACVPGVSKVEVAEGLYVLNATTDCREAIAAAAVPHGLLELDGRERLEDTYLRLTASEATP